MSFFKRDLPIVCGLFLASQLLYAWLGVRFDAVPFPQFMQFIDRELLTTRLVESLWYYHANPPMLNLLTGVGYKAFGDGAPTFLSIVFHLMGLALALSVYVLTWRFTASRPAAIAAAGLLAFSPAFVLYENWLMYTFPAVTLLTMSAVGLWQYIHTARTAWCAAFFGTLALLLLTRSLFHLVWMVVVLALLLVVLWDRRRQIIVAAIVPVLVVTAWYGKNYVQFGFFGSSSWMGLGLSNIATLVPTREELQPLVDEGRLSPFALISRYEQVDTLFALPRPPTGVPVLDQLRKSTGDYNYNNVIVVALNDYYTADALTVIRHFPRHYLTGLSIANRMFFSPATTNLYLNPANRNAAWPMEQVSSPLLYGTSATPGWIAQPHFGFERTAILSVNTSIPLIVAWCVLLSYGLVQALRGAASPDRERKARAVASGFIVVTAAYVYVVGTTFELAENYRYRYLVEPLLFVLAAAAITDAVRRLRVRIAARGRERSS